MKQLLSTNKTKDELTAYLANKLLSYDIKMGLTVVVAWRDQCECSTGDFSYLSSSQEEADAKLILHSLDVHKRIPYGHISIFPLDTDVLVLAIHMASELSENTYFCTGVSDNRCEISVRDIYGKLGHAVSDNTGSFVGKGKPSFWNAYQRADDDTLQVLADMGTCTSLSDEQLLTLEQFVCRVYCPSTKMTTVSAIRWHLFRKKLPPTRAALTEAFKRAHYQCLVWSASDQPNPQIPHNMDDI